MLGNGCGCDNHERHRGQKPGFASTQVFNRQRERSSGEPCSHLLGTSAWLGGLLLDMSALPKCKCRAARPTYPRNIPWGTQWKVRARCKVSSESLKQWSANLTIIRIGWGVFFFFLIPVPMFWFWLVCGGDQIFQYFFQLPGDASVHPGLGTAVLKLQARDLPPRATKLKHE